MLINNLLPAIAGLSTAPVTPGRQATPQTNGNDRARFIVDVPAANVHGAFDQALARIDQDSAADQANSFQLLLDAQQLITAANNNTSDATAPFRNAAAAYAAAEDVAQFAKPAGIYIGTL